MDGFTLTITSILQKCASFSHQLQCHLSYTGFTLSGFAMPEYLLVGQTIQL